MEPDKNKPHQSENLKREFQQLESKLLSAIRTTIKDELLKALKIYSTKDSSSTNKYLSSEKAADLLNVKLGTIYSKVEKGDLPYYRSGKRKLLFSIKDIEEYLEKRKGKITTKDNVPRSV